MVVVVSSNSNSSSASRRRGRAATAPGGKRATATATTRRRSNSSNGRVGSEEGSQAEGASSSDGDDDEDAHPPPPWYKSPPSTGLTSILQRRGAATAVSDDDPVTHNLQQAEAEDKKEDITSSSNSPTTNNYINSSLLQPLLKYLPRSISLDPSNLRRLLGSVHPSAFGAYRTKEAWRKENPDVLYSAYAARRDDSCHPPLHSPTSGESSVLHSPDCLVGASSPPPGYSEPHSPPDVFNLDDYRQPYPTREEDDDVVLDWEAEEAEMARRGRSCDISPVGSVSSLAELGKEAMSAIVADNGPEEAAQDTPPSQLAVYLSKPPEEQSSDTISETLAPTPTPLTRPSLIASRPSKRSFSPAFSASGASHSSSPGPVPMRPGVINRSLLTRQRSSSSLATSSSVCTCASNVSNASRTSSIRFAALPDADELKRLRGGRKNEKSFTMGIAGRKNLLLGKTGPDAEVSLAEGEDFDDFGFDDLDGGPHTRSGSTVLGLNGEDDSSESEVDEFDGSRTRRHKRADGDGDAAIRINEDGELIEKRPLGVTLEDLHLPMKRTKHSRGRLRSATDSAASGTFQAASRAVSSPPALSHAELPPQASISSEPLSPSATLAGASHSLSGPSNTTSSPTASAGAIAIASPVRVEEKTPMQTPYYERHDIDFTPMPTPRSRSPIKAMRAMSAMLATTPLEAQSDAKHTEPELAHDRDQDASSLSESAPESPASGDDDDDDGAEFESDASDDNDRPISDTASRLTSVLTRKAQKSRTSAAAGRGARKAATPASRRAGGVKRAPSASRTRSAATA